MGCRAAATSGMRCLPGGGKGGACVTAGAACAAPEQCCAGRCLPDGDGVFSCRDGCAPVGARCSAAADCCDGRCGGPPGATVCLYPAGATPTAGACIRAGEPCDLANPRCCIGGLCSQLLSGGTSCVGLVID